MKCYFDNRNNDGISLIVCLDGQLYDKLFLRKNAINLIEIPDGHSQLKLSFNGSYEKPEKVTREIVENLPIDIKPVSKKKISILEAKIRFPYDTIIDLSEYEHDLIFYPALFEYGTEKNIFYFQAINAYNGYKIAMKLKKYGQLQVKEKHNSYKKKCIISILLCVCAFVLGKGAIEDLYDILNGTKHVSQHVEGDYWRLARDGIIVGILGVPVFIIELYITIRKKNTYREELLVDECFVTECGEFKII